MPENIQSVKGFSTEDGIARYDYDALLNKPEKILDIEPDFQYVSSINGQTGDVTLTLPEENIGRVILEVNSENGEYVYKDGTVEDFVNKAYEGFLARKEVVCIFNGIAEYSLSYCTHNTVIFFMVVNNNLSRLTATTIIGAINITEFSLDDGSYYFSVTGKEGEYTSRRANFETIEAAYIEKKWIFCELTFEEEKYSGTKVILPLYQAADDFFVFSTKVDDVTIILSVDVDSNFTVQFKEQPKIESLPNPYPLSVGEKQYDGSAPITLSAADLGLAGAMKFLGITQSDISDGATTNPIVINSNNIVATNGNVVLCNSKEFVWVDGAWEELGSESSFKLIQDSVADPISSGTSIDFIDSISQDSQGKIFPTKKTVPLASQTNNGLLSAEDKKKLDEFKEVVVDSALSSTSTNPVQNKVVNTALNNYLPLKGGTLNNNATINLVQYGNRTLTLSGNSIVADMSKTTGGWAGSFASVKDPVGDITTMLGWYGGEGGLNYIFMGGSYGSPFLKMTKNGKFTFSQRPYVGADEVALKKEIPTDFVSSINNKTGAVTINASDIGAEQEGTADLAVQEHNNSTTSHEDIRESVLTLQEQVDNFTDVFYIDVTSDYKTTLTYGPLMDAINNKKELVLRLQRSYSDEYFTTYDISGSMVTFYGVKTFGTTDLELWQIILMCETDYDSADTDGYSVYRIVFNISNSLATSEKKGLLSAADKAKLDTIAEGATANIGDITEVIAGNGLTGGGQSGAVTLNIGAGPGITVANDNISLDESGVSAGTYGPSTNVTGANGVEVKIPEITVDNYGRVTKVTNRTYSSKDTTYNVATSTVPGLIKSGGDIAVSADGAVFLNSTAQAIVDAKTNDISGNAFQRAYGSLIPYGTKIPENSDLNTVDFIQVGNYYNSKNAEVATFTNCPTKLAFMMQVYSPLSTAIDNETTETWVYRLRKLTTHKGDVYYQSINSGATAGVFTYGSWIKVAKISDIPTKLSQLVNDSNFITIDEVPAAPVQSVNGKIGAVSLSASDVGALPNTTVIPTVPDSLKNPHAMTINNQSYDGSSAVNFTNTIDNIIDTKMHSVKTYGAVGDGTTDDTLAFATAMKENRVVFVPGGTYKLSGTLVIRENCCLELCQDTILDFTQKTGNCIEMRGSATLRGNHGNINVYGSTDSTASFSGNVISVDTGLDGVVHASIPPYVRATPQFKRQRFIYDVNITKTTNNFQSSWLGEHSGTALYISANFETTEEYDGSNTAPITFIWAMTVSGLRIGGAFDYGINIVNRDNTDSGYGNYADPSWTHDMRIEAVIEGCETGVRAFNCNTAHLDVTFQPTWSISTVDGAHVKYAKNGIILEHCRWMDLSQSIVWDWNSNNTLKDEDPKNAHIALIGNCPGVILSDFLYNAHTDDIRSLIYTDTKSNFDSLVILQEPFTRWFKPVDSKPYFFNGYENKELQLKDDKITLDQAGFIIGAEGENVTIPNFTNLAAEYGYTDNTYILGGKQNNGATSTLEGFVTTGFIPIEPAVGHIYRIGGRSVVAYEDATYGTYFRICWYDADKNAVNDPSPMGKFGSSEWYPAWVEDDTVAIAFATTPVYNQPAAAAYIRISLEGSGADMIVTIDEEQTYTTKWEGTPGMLDESVYAQKTLIKSPDGKLFELKVSNDGVISTSIYSG